MIMIEVLGINIDPVFIFFVGISEAIILQYRVSQMGLIYSIFDLCGLVSGIRGLLQTMFPARRIEKTKLNVLKTCRLSPIFNQPQFKTSSDVTIFVCCQKFIMELARTIFPERIAFWYSALQCVKGNEHTLKVQIILNKKFKNQYEFSEREAKNAIIAWFMTLDLTKVINQLPAHQNFDYLRDICMLYLLCLSLDYLKLCRISQDDATQFKDDDPMEFFQWSYGMRTLYKAGLTCNKLSKLKGSCIFWYRRKFRKICGRDLNSIQAEVFLRQFEDLFASS